MVPCTIASRIHGMTSSSISSSDGRRLEPEHLARLLDGGDAALHVVLERVVVHDPERLVGPLIFRQIDLGELEHSGRRRPSRG